MVSKRGLIGDSGETMSFYDHALLLILRKGIVMVIGGSIMDFTTLFLSHGSPMMVLEDTPTRRFLKDLGRSMPRPRAVIAVSAHWQTNQPVLGFAAWPDKINDIFGFPPELYQIA
jgi:aromatic ring-opening dioxygenase catalytic subunit (LigB family)